MNTDSQTPFVLHEQQIHNISNRWSLSIVKFSLFSFFTFTVAVYFLARSAKLPTGLYILPYVISFFFNSRQIISEPTVPSFAIFAPNDRYLSMTDLDLFFDSSRDVAMATC